MTDVFHDACVLTMKALLVTFGRWEVHGRENVPHHGPLIITANHLNMADPPLLSASIPRHIVFMAKKELWLRPLSGWIVSAYGAFPVDRGGRDVQALRKAVEVLRSGHALGMFPEGTRSRSGHLGAGHPGTALVALRSRAPILPVGIAGTEAIDGPRVLVRRPRIVVNIGRPYVLPHCGPRIGRDDVAAATALIMERIAELLPERYRPLPSPSAV